MERTIRMTGTGKLSVKPDLITCHFTLSGLHKDYGKAVKLSIKETKVLKECVASTGLNKDDLKTTSFHVDTEYSYYTDQNTKRQTKVFEGYRYQHALTIEFPNDNAILGKLFVALSNCPLDVEFTIGYTVADANAVKNRLLERAVADSREKAEILASAAGVKLGMILSIDYSWDELQVYSDFAKGNSLMSRAVLDGEYNMDFNFKDIDVQDTVTIVWEILPL